MEQILSLASRPPVLVSVVVALVGLAISGAGRRLLRIRLPAAVVAAAAVGAGLSVVATGWSRYRQFPIGPGWWIWPVAGIATGVAAGVFGVSAERHGPDLTMAAAAAAVGAFLCVPETTLLELLPGPLIVVALGSSLGWLQPLGVVGGSVLSLALGGLVLVDGAARGSAVVGGSACLAAICLVIVAPRPVPDATGANAPGPVRPRLVAHLTLIAVVVVCARIAGLQRSSVAAAAISAVALAAGLAVVRLWPTGPDRRQPL